MWLRRSVPRRLGGKYESPARATGVIVECFGAIQSALESRKIDILSSGFERIPQVTKPLNDEQIKDVDKLLEKLEEDDDVQNVYHTMQE